MSYDVFGISTSRDHSTGWYKSVHWYRGGVCTGTGGEYSPTLRLLCRCCTLAGTLPAERPGLNWGMGVDIPAIIDLVGLGTEIYSVRSQGGYMDIADAYAVTRCSCDGNPYCDTLFEEGAVWEHLIDRSYYDALMTDLVDFEDHED
jgi:hypothetical protein